MSDGNHDWNEIYRKAGAGEKAARAGKRAAGALLRTTLKLVSAFVGFIVFFCAGLMIHIAIHGGAPRGGSTIAGVMGFLGIYIGWQVCSWVIERYWPKDKSFGFKKGKSA